MKEKKFKPKSGQTDYTHARLAPVINCVLCHRGKILLVRRSGDMRLYPGLWSGISGFLDDQKNIKEKVAEELREELGLSATAIRRIQLGQIFLQEAPKYKKTWIVQPVLVNVATRDVRLDWEGSEYRWIRPSEVKQFKLLPGFQNVLLALKPYFKKA